MQSARGPEAGVWVIAETKDLLTNFIKIVVTDDQGRFMVPEVPDANYSVCRSMTARLSLIQGCRLVLPERKKLETRSGASFQPYGMGVPSCLVTFPSMPRDPEAFDGLPFAITT